MNDGLKILRSELGLTQVELAKELNMSFSTINRWENGRIRPTPENCSIIINFARTNHVSQTCLESLEESFSFARSRKQGEIVRLDKVMPIDKDLICLLAEESDTAIYVTDDKTYNVLYMNHAAEEMMEIKREEAIGKRCHEVIIHSDSPCSFCKKEKICSEKFRESFVESLRDGTIYSVRTKRIKWNGRVAHVHYMNPDKNELILQNVGSATAIFSLEDDGSINIRYGNKLFYELLEGDHAAVSKAFESGWKLGIYDESMHTFEILHKRIMEQKGFAEETIKCKTLKGTTKYITCKASYVDGGNKQRDKIYVTYIDITDRIIEEQKKNIIIENMPGAVVAFEVKDKMLHVVYISPKCEEITGFTPEETCERNRANPIYDVHPDDQKSLFQNEWSDIQQGKSLEYTYQVICKDGKYKWVHLSLSPVVTEEKIMYYGMLRDVNEEHIHDLLRDNLANALPGGVAVYTMNKNGVIETLYFNDGLPEMTGHTIEEYKRLTKEDPYRSFVLPEEQREIGKEIYNCVDCGKKINISFRIRHKNGTLIWTQLTASKIREEDGRPVYYAIYTKPTDEAIQYQRIVNDAAVGVIVVDTTSEILYLNSACAPFFHEKPETLVRKYTGRILEKERCILKKQQCENLPTNYYEEFHLAQEDGTRIRLKGRKINWCGRDAYIYYVEDETEEYEEHERIRKLLNQIPTGVGIIDILDGNLYLSNMNDGYYHMIGETKERRKRFLGFGVADGIWKADRQLINDEIQKVIDGEDHINLILRLNRYKNNHIWVKLSGRVVERTNERIRMFCGFADVDKQQKTRLEMQRQKQLLNLALKSAKMDVWDLDVINRRMFYSPDSQNKLGTLKSLKNVPESLIEEQFIHPDSVEDAKILYENVYRGKKASKELKIRQTNGEYEWERLSYIPVYDEYGNHIESVGNAVNITDEKLQKQLEKSLKAAKMANQVKSDFISRVSHDMRTPLNGIFGMLHMIQDKPESQAIMDELAELEVSSQQLLTLINDTLDFSEIESGRVILKPIIYQSWDRYQMMIRMLTPDWESKEITFTDHVKKEEFYTLEEDAARLQQILMNVIGNAIKFTHRGGNIDFYVSIESESENIVTKKFMIRDNGIGISKEFLPYVFDAFRQEYQGKTSRYRGTGLGLTLTKQLVDMMDGQITVWSEKNQGTEVTIVLPLKKAKAHENQVSVKKKNDLSCYRYLKGKRVLVCEDHPLNAQITLHLLKKAGIDVDLAENGQIGVDLIEKSIPGYYHAVIMDIRMPVMDGLEATRNIRKLDRGDVNNLPIIALTANVLQEDIQSALKSGMNAHLCKPIDPMKFYQTLDQYLSVENME